MEIIARIYNDLPDKFGLPRQSGMAMSFLSRVEVQKPYGVRDAFRGMERFDHIWLLWGFEHLGGDGFSPTVRPPRLGGNTRLGVFATRSPNRPNHIGMSVVRLERMEFSDSAATLFVRGADIKSGSPIYDIKPYLPYADSVPDALCDMPEEKPLSVVWETASDCFSGDKLRSLEELLSFDPRPRYQKDPERIYRMSYAGYDISFLVEDNRVRVVSVDRI